jgi:hypothetical protein
MTVRGERRERGERPVRHHRPVRKKDRLDNLYSICLSGYMRGIPVTKVEMSSAKSIRKDAWDSNHYDLGETRTKAVIGRRRQRWLC